MRTGRTSGTKSPRRVSARRRAAWRRFAAAATALVVSSVLLPWTVPSAVAAPGDPFPVDPARVFVAQNDPTGMYTAIQGAGSVTFVPDGPTSGIGYNGIGYRVSDNYIYGMQRTPVASKNNLVRVGQGGVVTVLGTVSGLPTLPGIQYWNAGTFGAGASADTLFVRASLPDTSDAVMSRLYAVNVTTLVATPIPLSQPVPNTSDIIFKDGFVWAFLEGTVVYRINPTTGQTSAFDTAYLGLSGAFGAQWVYGNGNVGLSDNATGVVTQVRINNPTSASPTFEIVSRQTGPSSANNDGTASPGMPTDLAVVKTGPAEVAPGGTFTYTLTVTNNGPGTSSGFTLRDAVPFSLTGVSSPTPGCTVGFNVVTCTGAGLPPGGSTTIQIVATMPPGATACVVNTATVLANESDPNSFNNVDDATTCPTSPALSITKSSNATEDSRIGDVVTYTVTATNTGDAPYTAANPAVVTDDLTGVLDDATYNGDATASVGATPSFASPRLSWSGPLAQGASVVLTYSVTLTGAGDGLVRNVAFRGNGPTPPCSPPVGGIDPGTGVPCAETRLELPRLTIAKTASTSTLPAVGSTVTYTVTVTNVGPGDTTVSAPARMDDDLSDVLDDADLDESSIVASSGTAGFTSPVISWEGPLAAGESATVSYTLTYTAGGDHVLENLACLPASISPGTPPCATVVVPGSNLRRWKEAEASSDPVVAGSTITYTLFFENLGAAPADVDAVDDLTFVADDADVTQEPVAGVGLAAIRTGDEIAITGSVAPGQTAAVSYVVTVRPDGERGDDTAVNFLLGPDQTPPSTPDCDPADPDLPDCTSTPIAAVVYTKSVAASDDPVRAGTVLTYTVTIESTGTVTAPVAREDVLSGVLDDAELTGDPESDTPSVTVSGVAAEQFAIGGELAPGATATVTYQVTVRPDTERGDNRADNFLVPPGGTPPAECAEGDAGCTSTPIPLIVASKSSDPAPGTTVQAGDEVTYTLTFANEGEATGPVDHTDDLADVLDDATLVTAPTSSDGALVASAVTDGSFTVTGSLAPGQSVTVSYTVSVDPDGERGDNLLGNVLAPTGTTDPQCEDDTVSCTEHPVAQLVSWKSVEPDVTPVVAGTVLTYTLFFENVGRGVGQVDHVDDLTHVLDDADVTVEPGSDDLSVVRDGAVITIAGPVPAGETFTVSYQVTVRADGERGDDLAANFLLVPGEAPPVDPVCEPEDAQLPDCTVTPIGSLVTSKSVEASSDPVEEGTELTYTLTFVNPGPGPVEVSKVDDLSGVLDDADLVDLPVASDGALSVSDVVDGVFSVTGSLAGGQTVTVTYTVVVRPQGERGDHRATNFLVDPEGVPPAECVAGDAQCTSTPLPFIEASKGVDPEPGTSVGAGEVLTYTLTFTNSGEGAGSVDYTDLLGEVLDDAQVTALPVASDGALTAELGSDETIRVTGVLGAGQSVTVTYAVTVLPDGERGDNLLGNFLVPTGEEPPQECVADDPTCTQNPVWEVRAWKSVEPDVTPVVAGTVLTYTLFFENVGRGVGQVDHVDDLTHVLDDVDVTVEPGSDDLSVVRDGAVVTIAGPVPAGETFTVSYQVTVRGDGERGDDLAANFLLVPGEAPPVDPVCQPSDAERPDCTLTPVGQLAVGKAVSASSDPVVEGTVLTYTLTFDNQGQGPVAVDSTDILDDVLDDTTMITPPFASDDALVASDVVDGSFRVTGELAAGQTVTVTYQVEVNDEANRGNDSADNFLVSTGDEPPSTCVDGDATCTVTPLPNVGAAKSSDPASGTTVLPDQDVTYTLTFANTGSAAGPVDHVDDLSDVLDDADLTVSPQSSDPALTVSSGTDGTIAVTGTLAAGQTVTVSYTVTVRPDGARGDNRLGNVLLGQGEEPPATCEAGDPRCTEHPVPEIVAGKSVDPVSGTPVVAGRRLVYTLTFANVGQAPGSVDRVDDLTHVLDDADLTVEPAASDTALVVTRDANRISITGSLEPGQVVTVTYEVLVRPAGERGDDVIANFLLRPGEETPTEPVCEPGAGELVEALAAVDMSDCTTNLVGEIAPSKSVSPESGTTVREGQVLTYTLAFENTGQGAVGVDFTDHLAGVLDDADWVGNVTTTGGLDVSGPTADALLVTGTVEPGETATATYQVRVRPHPDQGDHQLVNFLVPTGTTPASECVAENPLCTQNPTQPPAPVVPDPPSKGLAHTGSALVGIVGAGSLLLLLGIALLLGVRRRGVHRGTGVLPVR